MSRWVGLGILIFVFILGLFLTKAFESNNLANAEALNQDEHLPQDLHEWHEFNAPSGEFKVLIPGLPHHAKESNQEFNNNETRNYELYVANKDDGTLFSIYLITFPQRKNEEMTPDFLLNFITDMLNTNQSNKIQFVKSAIFNKMSAVDFSVESHDAMIDGKAFVRDNTLYVLSTTAKTDHRNKKEYEFFVNSFHLNGNKQK